MSEMTTPAGSAGGNPITSADLADLPDKIRVHALAKLLDKSSREVLDALTDLGEDGRSAQSSISRDVALKVAETLLGTLPEAAPEPEPEPEPEPVRPAAAAPPLPVFASASPLFLPPEPPKAPAKPAVRVVEERDEPDEADGGSEDDHDAADDAGD